MLDRIWVPKTLLSFSEQVAQIQTPNFRVIGVPKSVVCGNAPRKTCERIRSSRFLLGCPCPPNLNRGRASAALCIVELLLWSGDGPRRRTGIVGEYSAEIVIAESWLSVCCWIRR